MVKCPQTTSSSHILIKTCYKDKMYYVANNLNLQFKKSVYINKNMYTCIHAHY